MPQVRLREKLKVNKYDPNFKHAEDYELWVRLQKIVQGANLPAYLLKYRFHGENISITQNSHQLRLRKDIIKSELESWGVVMTEEDYRTHISTFIRSDDTDIETLRNWFYLLQQKNHYFLSYKFNAFLLSRWMWACFQKRCYKKLFCFIFPSSMTIKYLLTILYEKK